MHDREKVIKNLQGVLNYLKAFENRAIMCVWVADALALLKEQQQQIWELQDQVEYLTDKQKKKFLVDSDGKITPLPDVIRCKYCKYFDQSRLLCNHPTSHVYRTIMPDWYCADGEHKEGR